MRGNVIKAILMLFLLWVCVPAGSYADEYADESERQSCTGSFTNLNQWPVVQVPKRVLLIPLLKRKSGTNENELWPERPASILADFYRRRFQAEVVWLRDVRTWDDFYLGVDRLLRQQATAFDRVIFIGHGGFDGPVLNRTEILQPPTIKGSEGIFAYAAETQPGKQQIFSLTYDVSKNRIFSNYINDRWRDLVKMDPEDATRQLHAMKNRLQPMDYACYERYCAPLRSAAAEDEEARIVKLDSCQYICREPLFVLTSQDVINAERFFHFANSLASLARKDGLVFFGECNPGTPTPDTSMAWDSAAGWLVKSRFVGGPYKTYVHMFASVSGRISAGPIGDSSADDIVRRIITLESDGHQHRLCIAGP